ncbi:penicillin acylase family protein [soil metagenome]
MGVRLRGIGVTALATCGLAFASAGTAATLGAETARGGSGAKSKVLKAQVRRTKFGIPHIKAKSIRSLAAGYGFAFAEDNFCTLAEEYVTTRAKRSKFFGPEATWTFSGNGSTYKNIDADIYFKWVKEQKIVEDLMKTPPPLGPKPGVKQGVRGFKRGFNLYLKRTGVNNLPDERCRGAEWVRPITAKDMYRRFFQLGILASSGAVIDGLATAAPSGPGAAAAQDQRAQEMFDSGEAAEALKRLQPQIGSNAYGFGGDATSNGKGLVYGNPHFPWDGSERLYQSHLKIPGKLDVAGASLYGVPLILIGHTRGLAWSHTVATAWRFTPFKLTLSPTDPYSYVVDGQTKAMEKTDVTVQTKQEDGTLQPVTRSIYSTEYGPMITSLVGIPLPWGGGNGFALNDVNATNFRYLNHFFDNNKAQNVRQYDRIQRRYQGIPWVNSIAADSRGESYYSMQGAIPYVTNEKSSECNVAAAAFSILGLPILDGSRSDCNWDSSSQATAPGTFPPDEVPTQFRDDYVHNGNDSHWLANPEAPLTGFDRIIGIENAERTFRTRVGLIQIEDRLAGADGLPGNTFNRKRVERVAFQNRVYLGELWRDQIVQLCDLAPGGFLLGSSGPVDVSGACDPLRDWDLSDNLDSNGAVLFRRFVVNLTGNFRCLPTGLQGSTCVGQESIFTTPYSNADPVHTPRGLLTANPLVGLALADAVTDMNGAGLPLDSPLDGVQSEVRGGETISVHGGPHGSGVFNVISANWRPNDGGYTNVRHGGSFIMSAQFTNGKCPVKADTFVTYGQSENQDSPHASDYTKAYASKKWLHEPFCGPDVRRKTLDKVTLRLGRR